MPRPRRRQGENRERLIEAGIAEFGTRGYHGASTTSIAQLALVPQPHVYANFRTKHELFLVCADRTVERLLTAPDDLFSNAQELTISARFVYQLLASLSDDALHEHGRRNMLELRSRLGQERFEQLILHGARSLIG